MVITKTKFMNYMRCPRYVALDMLKSDLTKTSLTYEEYVEEEYSNQEALGDIDLDTLTTEAVNAQLEALMPYYNEIEILAGKRVDQLFGGTTKCARTTFSQECFRYLDGGINFMCYVDVFNYDEETTRIIEVKATSSNGFLSIGTNSREHGFASIWEQDEQGIYKIKTNVEVPFTEKSFNNHLAKLYDRFHDVGRYVWDIAIQRHIIEEELKSNDSSDEITKMKYYLAVLNGDYAFDGKYQDGKPVYGPDENGNEIITLFDVTDITANLQDKVRLAKQRIIQDIKKNDVTPCPVGKCCEIKKTTVCSFKNTCFKDVPECNSVLNVFDIGYGIKDLEGQKYTYYDLINAGMLKLSDIPYEWLTKEKQIIQRDCYDNYQEYIDHPKVKRGLDELKYPIYHLDFESFNSPLPRFKGEKCYTQSVFQYSLHIEHAPGECDFDNDHYEYLAKSFGDERRDLVESLIKHIDKPGTVLVYHQTFEKSRIAEFSKFFPDLKKELNAINEMVFDLMLILKGSAKLYKNLGFEEDKGLFNYYHPGLSGSYSIKRVLPVFSDISYSDLKIGNGLEAMTAYATYPNLSELEHQGVYNNLLKYCKQDTWAMVKILDKLRQKNVSNSVERIVL